MLIFYTVDKIKQSEKTYTQNKHTQPGKVKNKGKNIVRHTGTREKTKLTEAKHTHTYIQTNKQTQKLIESDTLAHTHTHIHTHVHTQTHTHTHTHTHT